MIGKICDKNGAFHGPKSLSVRTGNDEVGNTVTPIGMILSTLGIYIKIGFNLKLHGYFTEKVSYLLGR
jgi:hypothetical protein